MLTDTVTVILPPAAKVPLLVERLIHVCDLLAVQSRELPPVLVRRYVIELGLKGPPTFPDAFRPPAGVTAKSPGVAFTVKLTERLVFPIPEVAFTKFTVSE